MKKFIYGICLALSLTTAFPLVGNAKTKEEAAIVKELTSGLPVYMGNGMTWNTFDIDDNGQIVIGLISQNLPDVSGITDDIRSNYRDILVGPQSGYVKFSKQMGKKLRVNVYNQNGDLCISETYTPE
ncbi:MAG: hypothetical protein K2N05_07800 [Muribaculaceae bacterium]|nr:hypothetical protein [Muribaculaceae bacterium]